MAQTNIPDTDFDQLTKDCVSFAQELIRTPSMPGQEDAVGELVSERMRHLDFDDVWGDSRGNVYGRIHGRDRGLPALVLNSHLDHVDPGDTSLWSTPPYAAEIVGGRIIGRGAADIKGPLAVQIYAMAGLFRAGGRPRRDVVFTGVVEEEIGGAGAIYWINNVDYPVALVVLGEPSSNNLALGHRGIFSIWVTFRGRSVHASVPDKGDNPNFELASFLVRLKSMQADLSSHTLLGPTTVAPTIVEVDTGSINVTPAWARVLLDFRSSTESPRSLQKFVRRVADDATVQISSGFDDGPLADSPEPLQGYYTSADEEAVIRIRQLIASAIGRKPELISYQFATDGRHFADRGFPIVGYSPGEESQAHIANESIDIGMMTESLRAHTQLLLEF